MEIHVVAVGKLRRAYREACDDYAARLRRYARYAEHEVREASRAPTGVRQRQEEASRLRERIPEGATVVALSRDGELWSSREVAARLDRWALAARPVALVIGGSTGLDPSLLATAAQRWSLGPLTLPHELARVVVVEQIYRGFTILRGEPYHKGGGR